MHMRNWTKKQLQPLITCFQIAVNCLCKCQINAKYAKKTLFSVFFFSLAIAETLDFTGFLRKANSGNRTRDLRITSASLYRLSHVSLPVPLYHLF